MWRSARRRALDVADHPQQEASRHDPGELRDDAVPRAGNDHALVRLPSPIALLRDGHRSHRRRRPREARLARTRALAEVAHRGARTEARDLEPGPPSLL